MKVSPSLFVPPIKIVILFGLRFDMVAFWWLFYGIVLGLFGTVWHYLVWQHLMFFICV